MEGKVSWGLTNEHWKGPTPKRKADLIDMWMGIFGALTLLLNSAPFLNATQASTVSWFLGGGVAILPFVKKFYSVEITSPTVPTKDVDVADIPEPKTD